MSKKTKDKNKIPSDYVSILVNGDQGIYANATIEALTQSGAKKPLVDAVKNAGCDLEISQILIMADRFDILVDVFKGTDSYTAMEDYIIKKDYEIDVELKKDLEDIDEAYRRTVNSIGKIPSPNSAIYKKFEEKRERRCEKARDKSERLHEIIYTKYKRAWGRRSK